MCFLEPNRIYIRKSLQIAFKKEMYQSRDTLMDDPVRVSMEICYTFCNYYNVFLYQLFYAIVWNI
jgi:hypothetical protein